MASLPQTQPNALTHQGKLMDTGAANFGGVPNADMSVEYVRDSASPARDGRVGMGTLSQRQRTPEPGGNSDGSGRTSSDESPQAG